MRSIGRSVLVLLAAFASGGAALEGHAAERNIVVVVADDHGCDAGCYGNPVIQTPQLDALAADGVVFDRAYCTTASCSSSRAVILTGLHGHTNGQYGLGHADHKFAAYADVASLPDYLSAAGYRTADVGKHHVYPASAFRFDKSFKASHRNPVAMADACRAWIEEDSDKPFFLYYATTDPHRGPVDADTPLRPNRFGNESSYAGVDEATYSPEDVIVPPFLPDTPECRAELAEYYRSVSRVDQGVGALVAILKDAGRWDNTLVVYVSDHGMPMQGAKTTLYDPGMRSPCVVRDPYAPRRGFRTDAMVSWTDLTPTLLDFAGALDDDRVNDAVSEAVASRAGQRSPRGLLEVGRFHGRSFLPVVRDDPDAERRDTVYGSHTFHEVTMYYPMRVVQEERFKLIWNLAHPLEFPSAMDLWRSSTWQAQHDLGLDAPYGVRTVGEYLHRPEFELFNLEVDPNEAHNLADDPTHAETLARLQAKLHDFQRRTGDPWRLKWDRE